MIQIMYYQQARGILSREKNSAVGTKGKLACGRVRVE